MRKIILHILSLDRMSGAENVAADICMMLNDGYDMIYASPDGDIRQSLIDRDVAYYPLEKMSLKEIKKVIRLLKPDIIHAHDIKATVLSCLSTTKIPIISHLHVNAENMRKISLKSILYMLSSKRVERIIHVSQSCIEDYYFKNLIKTKCMYLRNIVYYPRIEKLMNKDPNHYDYDFIYVGRLAYAKDPKRVATVASEVLKQLPDAKFGVIGEGDLKAEMVNVFRSEGVESQVIFTGKLPYPYKAIQQSKCLLMCSRFEGTPIVALEAIALRTPMVSTKTDGMVDLIINNETGFLSDDDHELADFIIRLLMNDELRRDLSNKQYETNDMLSSLSVYKEEISNLYESL